MARTLPLLLAAALAVAACGRSAAPPRTVPEADALAEPQRRAYLRALARQAEGDRDGADRALAPLLGARPLHVPSHLLHQDLATAGAAVEAVEAIAKEYTALSRERPGDAAADVLAVRALPAATETRLAGYQAAAVKDPAAPWPRVALATERADHARELVQRAEARERAGFPDDGKKLRAEARTSLDRARTEGERAVAVAPGLAAAHGALAHALAVAADLVPMEDRARRDLRGRAIERLGAALRIDGGDPRLLAARGMLLREVERGAEAQADLDAAALAAPADPAILAARARNLQETGRPDLAAEAWKKAAAAAPADPALRVDCASALAREGRWKDALEQYRRADALYAAKGGERWRARRGIVTALAQIGLDARDPARLAEALEVLRAYRAEGGPDATWAGWMAEVLGDTAAGGEPTEKPPLE